jgi:hypothetical protein
MKAELPIPPQVNTDPKAIELLRVWAAHGNQYVSIAAKVWPDPAAWGIMLVDLAKHVATAYQQTTGKDYLTQLNLIRKGMNAEWDSATDEPTGNLLD